MDYPGSKRILIVASEAEERRFIEQLLWRPEFSLVSAENAASGARLMRIPPPIDVVVVDLTLSDLSGMDFLRQLRARPQYDTLPVIVLAEAARPLEIRSALVAGADRYVTKSYMGNNLVKTVLEVLRVGRASASADS